METSPRSRPLAVRSTPGVSRAPARLQPARRPVPLVQRAVPTTHLQSQRSPNSDTKTHSPAARGQQPRGTRFLPRGCPSLYRSALARDLAPASTGAVLLALGRPPVPGGAHPGEASTASETRGSAPSVLGTDTAGTPYPRVPSLLGLLWLCTPAHRHTWTWTGMPERGSSRTIRTTAQCPRR